MDKTKLKFSNELAYVLGIVILAAGTALMERANFGMSMVVAPAYLIYLKVSQIIPNFTFGMAEYCLQAVLIIVLTIVMGKFKMKFLFSFVTAVIYGFVLDGIMALVALIPYFGIADRILGYVIGLLCCSCGVSLLFHTYFAPEAYELFVKEVSGKFNKDINKFKTGYDCTSCAVAVIMSFAFFGFGHFEGVKLGTILCALINGTTIGVFSRFFDSKFEFFDKLKLRKYFL